VHPDAGLLETLNAFQVGKSHLALVTRHARRLARAWSSSRDVKPGTVEVLGIITVEDVLEELIGEEIYDEDDYAQMSLLPHHQQPQTLPPGSEIFVPTGGSSIAPAAVAAAAAATANAAAEMMTMNGSAGGGGGSSSGGSSGGTGSGGAAEGMTTFAAAPGGGGDVGGAISGSVEVELHDVNLDDVSSFRTPCVLAAVRKFRLLAERGRRRRLQRNSAMSASAESLLDSNSSPPPPPRR
jgi:hypothetical protein